MNSQPPSTKDRTFVRSVKTAYSRLLDRFQSFVKKPYAYLTLCFLVPVVIMYLSYLVRGIHPFGDESVLVLDLNGQYVYFYEALRNAVFGKESLLYSFSRALGGEFLGIYAYYLASPLSYIVCLFPEGKILEALLCIFLIKTGLCGTTFGLYLHKTSHRVRPVTVICFSCMYALCSYALVHQHNSMWIDALIWLPLLTLAIESLIKEGRYKLFVIALTMTVMSNFYIGYMVCIYTALYFFYYLLAKGKESNPRGEKDHVLRSLLRIGAFSLLAIAISAVIVLAAYYSLSFGKTTFTKTDWSFAWRCDLADLFVKLLPGSYDTVRRSGLPMLYCGTLSLMMLPFYYLSHKIKLREKIAVTALLGVFILSFMISPVDIVWHGFQEPNWLNYRYSFMVSFILTVMAYRGFDEIWRRSSATVFAIAGIIATAVMVLSKFEYPNFELGNKYGFTIGKIDPLRTVFFTLIMLVTLCAVLYVLRHAFGKKRRQYSLILCLLVCAELFANSVVQHTSLDYDVVFSTYSSYNDYIDDAREAVDLVEAKDASFYRMEKTVHRKMNDSMTLGNRGLSGSTSTLNKETIEFLNAMGYASYSHWSKYMGGNPVADSILGIKYILCEKGLSEDGFDYHENMAYEEALQLLGEAFAETDDYTVYRNPYALSIAYAVSEQIKEFSFHWLDSDGNKRYYEHSPFERLNDLVTALVGSDEPIELFVPVEVTSSYTNGRKGYISGHEKYTFYDDDHSVPVYALFTAVMPTDALLYFHAPSEYPRECDLYINDIPWGDFMADDSDRIKAVGYRSEEEYVTAKLVVDEDVLYLKNNEYMFYYLDTQVFKQVMDKLMENQLILTDYSETFFQGHITTTEESPTVLTSIPYDAGWQVTVDGQAVAIRDTAEGVISFDIETAGEHEVMIRYAPTQVTLGSLISLTGVLIFTIIIVAEQIRKRRPKDND